MPLQETLGPPCWVVCIFTQTHIIYSFRFIHNLENSTIDETLICLKPHICVRIMCARKMHRI